MARLNLLTARFTLTAHEASYLASLLAVEKGAVEAGGEEALIGEWSSFQDALLTDLSEVAEGRSVEPLGLFIDESVEDDLFALFEYMEGGPVIPLALQVFREKLRARLDNRRYADE